MLKCVFHIQLIHSYTPQIEETLKYVEEGAPFDVSKLSTEGKKLVQDARNIISTVRLIYR